MPTRVQPVDPFFSADNGPIKTYYLELPTGLSISTEGLPHIKDPFKFIATIGRITDDQDLVKATTKPLDSLMA